MCVYANEGYATEWRHTGCGPILEVSVSGNERHDGGWVHHFRRWNREGVESARSLGPDVVFERSSLCEGIGILYLPNCIRTGLLAELRQRLPEVDRSTDQAEITA